MKTETKTIDADQLVGLIKQKAEFWRKTENDPHEISVALYVAFSELADAIEKATK